MRAVKDGFTGAFLRGRMSQTGRELSFDGKEESPVLAFLPSVTVRFAPPCAGQTLFRRACDFEGPPA
jgi:hypothetical protein